MNLRFCQRAVCSVVLLGACVPTTTACRRSKDAPAPTANAAQGVESPAGGPVQAKAPARSAWQATACSPGSAKTFEVGPDQANKTLASVPWGDLQPGDTVRIHSAPEPYREKVLFSASGTAAAPIRVCGVPDANGNLPVIEGSGAVTKPGLAFPSTYTEPRGVFVITETHDQRWGYKPSYIVIEGLEVRNGFATEKFTDASGKQLPYLENAAAIFVERGEHITVRGNVMHGCGNGFFVASSGDEATQSRDILVEGNYIYGNGSTGNNKDRHHNIYTEAIGITFQYNRLGPLREGSGGSALKDRSANTIIRYNWIEGGSRSLDLVEPEDSFPQAGKVPNFGDAYVYGNVFVATKVSASRVFHYGGDTGEFPKYRRGTLFFYNNTVVSFASEADHYFTNLFQLDTDEQTADVRNNLIQRVGDSHLTWSFEKGVVRLGTNWVTSPISSGRKEFTGKILPLSGKDQTLLGDDPKFRSFPAQDYCLAEGSPARGVGGALPDNLPAELRPTLQYKPHQSSIPRPRMGVGDDLGALSCP